MEHGSLKELTSRTDLVLGTLAEVSIGGLATQSEWYRALYASVAGNSDFPRPVHRAISDSIKSLMEQGLVEAVPNSPQAPIGGYAITASGAERLDVVSQTQ